jgi:hypothetical protein
MILLQPYAVWTDVEKGRLSICDDRLASSKYNAYFAARPRDLALAAVVKRIVAHVGIRFTGIPEDLPPELRTPATTDTRHREPGLAMYIPRLAITGPVAWGWAVAGMDVHTPCVFRTLQTPDNCNVRSKS